MTQQPPALTPESARFARLTLLLVLVLTALRLGAMFLSPLQLYPDEAQYWLWSRELDFGYFSKPPMIAWSIWLTTLAGGNEEPFVRLAGPLFHALTATTLFAVGRKLYDPRTGFAAAVIWLLMPGVALSSFVAATDAPLLCFLSLTLLAYVSLDDDRADLKPALGLGVALGLAVLSKYAALYFLAGMALHMSLSPEARKPWTARRALVAAAAFLVVIAPNLIWNANHQFATVGHTAANADLGGKLFNIEPMLEFVVGQLGVFGPVPFGVLAGAGITLAVRRRLRGADLLLACFTAPALAAMVVMAFVSRANANWAASAYVAGSVLTAALLTRDWQGRWRTAARVGLIATAAIQGAIALFLITAVANPRIADDLSMSNSLKRMRGWEQASDLVIDRARVEALNGGVTAIAVEDRFLFNAMAYYGRDYFAEPGAPPLRIWVRETAGNQAEAESPLTPDRGRRVLIAVLEDREGVAQAKIRADFAKAEVIDVHRITLSVPCKGKPGESDAKYDHRCVRRVTLMLAEGFAPVERR